MSGAIVLNLQDRILTVAATRLGRPVTAAERAFVAQHGGLLALESILERVETLPLPALARYLGGGAIGP